MWSVRTREIGSACVDLAIRQHLVRYVTHLVRYVTHLGTDIAHLRGCLPLAAGQTSRCEAPGSEDSSDEGP